MTQAANGRPETFTLLEPLEGRRMLSAITAVAATADAVSPAVVELAPARPGVVAMQPDHMAVLALVPDSAVTHRAVQSGDWTSPATWENGILPGGGANVLIPAGIDVTVKRIVPPPIRTPLTGSPDAVATARTLARIAAATRRAAAGPLRTLRVDGHLAFSTSVSTRLWVDTLVVAPGGYLEIGSPGAPIQPGVTARLLIADRGPIDRAWDPRAFSRGLISLGRVTMVGADKTDIVKLAVAPRAGETQLVLSVPPANWHVGDRLVLTGTRHGEDEVLTVRRIEGSIVTVDALRHDHDTPAADLMPYVGNLSRNIVVKSENGGDVGRRGHVMFMHSPDVVIDNAAFHDLGRSDKKIYRNDSMLDAEGQLVAGTGTNQQGRYAMHFHRTGLDAAQPPAIVRGAVVWGSPGWGFVNHSSHVNVEDSISFQVDGAGFVGEAGNEIGAFRNNLAVQSRGSGQIPDKRQFIPDRENDPLLPKNDDFGHSGHGFWLQGPAIEVTGNVAAGHRQAGFVFWLRGLREGPPQPGQDDLAGFRSIPNFPAANVIGQPELIAAADAYGMVRSEDVQLRGFSGNEVFASAAGLDFSRHMFETSPALRGQSAIEDFLAWRISAFVDGHGRVIGPEGEDRQGGQQGIVLRYARNLVLRNVRLLGDEDSPVGVGVDSNNALADVAIENPTILGWETGVRAARMGRATVAGGLLNNLTNIEVTAGTQLMRIDGVRFGTLPGFEQYDVLLRMDATGSSMRALLQMSEVTLDDRTIYFLEQAADAVPFPAGQTPSYVPTQYWDRTNQQLWDEFGIALGGAVAPESATSLPRIHGLVV